MTRVKYHLFRVLNLWAYNLTPSDLNLSQAFEIEFVRAGSDFVILDIRDPAFPSWTRYSIKVTEHKST